MGAGVNIYYSIFFPELLGGSPLHLQDVVTSIVQTGSQMGVALDNVLIATLLGEMHIGHSIEGKIIVTMKFQPVFYLLFGGTSLMFVILLFTNPVTQSLEEQSEVFEVQKIEEDSVSTKS